MQFYVDPDFTGFTLPLGLKGWWPLTEEQWWLATKCVVRELGRVYGPSEDGRGHFDEQAVRNQIQSDAAALIHALRVDPCKMFSQVPWGERINWRTFACLALWFSSYGPQSRSFIIQDIVGGNCQAWSEKVFAFGFPQVVINDEAYQNGTMALNAFCNVWWVAGGNDAESGHSEEHELYCVSSVDAAFQQAGGRDDHSQPTQPNYLVSGSAQESTSGSGFSRVLNTGADLPSQPASNLTIDARSSGNLFGLILSLGLLVGLGVWMRSRIKHGY